MKTTALKFWLALCAGGLVLFNVPAGADDKAGKKGAAKKEAIDPKLEADIREMLKLSGQGEIGVQVIQQMVASFKTALPSVPKKFWDEFVKEVDAGEIIEMVVPIYAKHFTREDIKAMVEFYKSPVGRKMIAKQPQITMESMKVGEAWGQGISERLMKRLEEEGY